MSNFSIGDRARILEGDYKDFLGTVARKGEMDDMPFVYVCLDAVADGGLKQFKPGMLTRIEAPETVNHPSHYNQARVECIDIIEDLGLNFNLGSALKYIWRAGRKDDLVKDLEKARWYLDRELTRLESQREPK